MTIERSRGAIIKFHHTGIRVVMYVDDPGKYFDERGEPLSEAIAKSAGFDIEALSRQREKEVKLAEYKQRLEDEFASAEEQIAAAMSSGSKLQAKHVGGGQYAIFDGETRVTKFALNKEEAALLIGEYGGDEDGGETTDPTKTEETKE